jgi:hypothetical protein
MLVALVALFVALGGPAQASRLITGRSIANHSITAVDLSRKTQRYLRQTPSRSVRSAQIADGQVLAGDLGAGAVGSASVADGSLVGADLAPGTVGPAQLAPGAVSASRLAGSSVSGASVADGTLQTVDVGSFAGSVSVDFDAFTGPKVCQGADFAPTPAGPGAANIADDVVVITPPAGWSDWVVVSAKPAANNQVRLVACDQPGDPVTAFDPGPATFEYVTFDAP